MSKYSLSYNEKRAHWQANIKSANGSWESKSIPKKLGFGVNDAAKAEAWLINYIDGDKPSVAAKVTLAGLAGHWLEFRYGDRRTASKTYESFVKVVNLWILDNPTRSHHSIQNLDIEKDLNVAQVRSWMSSMEAHGLSESSILSYASVLKSFLADAAAQGWIDQDYISPFARDALKRDIAGIAQQRSVNHYVQIMPIERICGLLHLDNLHLITQKRRVRYALGFYAGLRAAEVHGLTWDLVDLEAGTIRVQQQLLIRGPGPAEEYEELIKTHGKKEIYLNDRAVVKAPKRYSYRTIPMHPYLLEVLKEWRYSSAVIVEPDSKDAWYAEQSQKRSLSWRAYGLCEPQGYHPIIPTGSKSLREGWHASDFSNPTQASDQIQIDLERLEKTWSLDEHGYQIDFHSLRRCFSSELSRAGVSSDVIGELLGHRQGRSVVNRHYVARNMDQLADAVCRLPIPSPFTGTLRETKFLTGSHPSGDRSLYPKSEPKKQLAGKRVPANYKTGL